MFKAAIFDLDGTLLNTIEDLANASNYALRINGFNEHKIDDYKTFVGNGAYVLIQRILPQEHRSKENIDKVFSDFDYYYGLHMNDNTKPYTGIIELLDKLKSAGIKTAVVSNKPHQFTKEIISRYFDDKIDFVYGKREGYNTKPDPATVLEVVKLFNLNKDEIIYIGDSNVDMATAENAGLQSVGVSWGFRSVEELEEAGADFIAYDVDNLEKIIME